MLLRRWVMKDTSVIAELKSSSERMGQLYPILVDHQGNIIDGEHRYGVDKGWRTMQLDHIRTEKDRLIARIISNNVRRSVPQSEKTESLAKLGEFYLSKEGVEPGKISQKIMEETGMSYTWVMKYLPNRFKDSAQSDRAGTATRHVAGIDKLVDPPEDVLTIKTYANADFVNIMVKRTLYEQLEKEAKRLETKPDALIYNALLLMLEKIKRGKSAHPW